MQATDGRAELRHSIVRIDGDDDMTAIRLAIALLLLGFSLLTAAFTAAQAPTPDELCALAEPQPLTMMRFQAADPVLGAGVDYRAIFCAGAGAIYVDLYETRTPVTVNNFVFLAQHGYYDNTTFHRVIPNFMAQAGDPTGTGRGGPGYQFRDEPVGFLVFDRPGLLAMANAGPGTNGSQFFITTAPTPHLNHKHTIFGDVLVGQEIVEAIRERDLSAATEPGETLHTVLIIEDASQVDDSQVVDATPADQEQVIAAFEAFLGSMPPSLPANPETSGLFSAVDVAASLDDESQDAYAQFADAHALDYRYALDIVNEACESAIYFSALGYQVDVFANAEAAADALADPLSAALLEGMGYQPVVDETGIAMREMPTCADEPGWQVRSTTTIGRFLVALQVTLGQALLEQSGVSPAALMANLSLQIEPAFSDIYRRELR